MADKNITAAPHIKKQRDRLGVVDTDKLKDFFDEIKIVKKDIKEIKLHLGIIEKEPTNPKNRK